MQWVSDATSSSCVQLLVFEKFLTLGGRRYLNTSVTEKNAVRFFPSRLFPAPLGLHYCRLTIKRGTASSLVSHPNGTLVLG